VTFSTQSDEIFLTIIAGLTPKFFVMERGVHVLCHSSGTSTRLSSRPAHGDCYTNRHLTEAGYALAEFESRCRLICVRQEFLPLFAGKKLEKFGY
jgi:hypothetical protein